VSLRRSYSFAGGAIASLAFVVALAGCAARHPASPSIAPRPALINHLAFFKLKAPADAAALIADCDAQLGVIPGVVCYYAGQHLDTGRGDRIDSNYDVGFCVGFASADDYAAYVEHPNHQAMLAKWQPRWEWIRVVDVLDPTP
jgi:hypothetical protein